VCITNAEEKGEAALVGNEKKKKRKGTHPNLNQETKGVVNPSKGKEGRRRGGA